MSSDTLAIIVWVGIGLFLLFAGFCWLVAQGTEQQRLRAQRQADVEAEYERLFDIDPAAAQVFLMRIEAQGHADLAARQRWMQGPNRWPH